MRTVRVSTSPISRLILLPFPSSLVYRQADYPKYLPGLWATSEPSEPSKMPPQASSLTHCAPFRRFCHVLPRRFPPSAPIPLHPQSAANGPSSSSASSTASSSPARTRRRTAARPSSRRTRASATPSRWSSRPPASQRRTGLSIVLYCGPCASSSCTFPSDLVVGPFPLLFVDCPSMQATFGFLRRTARMDESKRISADPLKEPGGSCRLTTTTLHSREHERGRERAPVRS